MEFKGTKGEWKVSSLTTNLFIRDNNAEEDDMDCNCVDVYDHEAGIYVYAGENVLERKANTQLIATAPELLKDAIDLLQLVKNHATREEIQERIYETEKTINKAL